MTTQETVINEQLAELVGERNAYRNRVRELEQLFTELAPEFDLVPHERPEVVAVEIGHYTADRAIKFSELCRQVETLREKTAVTMGVGDGSGKLFVHGDYESIKAAQRILDERSALAKELDEARGVIMDSDCDSPSAALLNELREQHAVLRLSAERARDFLASIESGLEDQAQGRVDVFDHTVLHWVRTEFSASLALCGLEAALSASPPSPDSVIESLRRSIAEAATERDDIILQASILQDKLSDEAERVDALRVQLEDRDEAALELKCLRSWRDSIEAGQPAAIVTPGGVRYVVFRDAPTPEENDRWEKRVKLLERRNADAVRVLKGEVTL